MSNLTLTLRLLDSGPKPPSFYACGFKEGFKRSLACQFPGITAEQIYTIFRAAQIKYELVPIDWDSVKDTGFMPTVYRMIQSGQVDTGAMTFYPSDYRMQHFQVSTTIASLDSVAALGLDKTRFLNLSSWAGFLAVYDIYTWAGMLCLLIMLKCYKYAVRYTDRFRASSMETSTVHLSLAWLTLFLAFFGSLYSGGILSALLSKKQELLFTNLDELTELIEDGQLQIFAAPHTGWRDGLVGNNTKRIRRLARALEAHPLLEVADHEEFIKKLTSSNRARWQSAVFYKSDVLGNFMQTNQCSGTIIDLPEFGKTDAVFLFRKGYPKSVINRLNKAIMWHYPALLQISQKYVDDMMFQTTVRCNHSNQAQHVQKLATIHLGKMAGLFIAVAFAYFICACTLLAEFIS